MKTGLRKPDTENLKSATRMNIPGSRRFRFEKLREKGCFGPTIKTKRRPRGPRKYLKSINNPELLAHVRSILVRHTGIAPLFRDTLIQIIDAYARLSLPVRERTEVRVSGDDDSIERFENEGGRCL